MKKPYILLCIYFLALTLIFVGCSSVIPLLPQKEPPGLQTPLEYDVAIEFADFIGRAKIKAENFENFRFVFYEPESISGFEIRLENSVYHYEMNGIKIEHKQNTLPSQHSAMLLFLSLQSILIKSYTNASLSDNVWSYEGIVSNSIFIFTQNNETYMPISLNIPQMQLEVHFFPQMSEVI